MFKIIFNLIIAFFVAIFILETTSVIRPFSESLIQNGILAAPEAGSAAPSIIEVIIIVFQMVFVALEPILEVLMDIIYLAIHTVLSIQITISGLIYFLIIFIILSSLYDKYRNITLELNKLQDGIKNNVSNITLARALEETERHLSELVKKESAKKNTDLIEQATLIKELLLKINSSIETDKNTLTVRTKKDRRTQPAEKPRTKPKAKRKAKPKPKTTVPDVEPANILEDENISKIDLARALIESNDIKKAREILIEVAKSGTETEMHEAKLLYLQLK